MRRRDFSIIIASTTTIYLPLCLFYAPDVRIFLLPWLAHIRNAGPLGAFAHPFSNYAPPYLYLLAALSQIGLPGLWTIKLLSILGAAWLSWCVSQTVRESGGDPLLAAAITLLTPTVILNSAVLGQCDTFWVGCSLLAVAGAVNNQPYRMSVWAGLAFAFKAQGALLAPFYVGYMAKKRTWGVAAIPLVIYLLAISPAALLGWPIGDLLTVYIRQQSFTFIGDAPNLWAIPAALGTRGAAIIPLGYALGLGVSFIAALSAARSRDQLHAGLLCALVVPFFLPKMLERFFFPADILSLSAAIIRRDRQSVTAAVLIQVASLLSIIAYLIDSRWLNAGASLFVATALFQILRVTIQTTLAGRHFGRTPNENVKGDSG